MKMLDEVIDQLIDCHTNWARWSQTSDIVDRSAVEDAINYLKELRHILDNTVWVESTKEENGYWKLPMLPETGNDPLTWDELCKMEGKPVYMELLKGSWKGWDVVGGFTDDDFGEAMVTVRLDDYYKADLGKMWRAYRKEQEKIYGEA